MRNTSPTSAKAFISNGGSRTTTTVRDKAGWEDIYDAHVALTAQSYASLILVGDSITHGLRQYAKVWKNYFKPLNELNLGAKGD